MEISEVTYIIIFGSIAFISLAIFIVIVVLRFYNRNNLYLRNIERFENEKKQELLKSQLEIQEQTLKNISQEIHDNLGTTASVIKNYLLTLPINDPNELPLMLAETQNQVRQLIADVKSLSVRLSGDHIHFNGIVNSLNEEIKRISRISGLNVTLHLNESIKEPESGKSIILFRMIQETLNNAIKHSEAKNIEVNVTTSEKILILEISDDGKGFNVVEKRNSGGSGLLNLYSRANLIQANLNIQSSPGSGTKIRIELPLS